MFKYNVFKKKSYIALNRLHRKPTFVINKAISKKKIRVEFRTNLVVKIIFGKVLVLQTVFFPDFRGL